MIKVTARLTDLWRDDCGWSENASWVRQVYLEFPDGSSDLTIARRVKAMLGITGMRKDQWAGEEFSWRDGCIGAYALIDY